MVASCIVLAVDLQAINIWLRNEHCSCPQDVSRNWHQGQDFDECFLKSSSLLLIPRSLPSTTVSSYTLSIAILCCFHPIRQSLQDARSLPSAFYCRLSCCQFSRCSTKRDTSEQSAFSYLAVHSCVSYPGSTNQYSLWRHSDQLHECKLNISLRFLFTHFEGRGLQLCHGREYRWQSRSDCTLDPHTASHTSFTHCSQGEFTARTTIPTLTLYRVGCMPFTTVISRRDHHGAKTHGSVQTHTVMPNSATEKASIFAKRTIFEASSIKALLSIAEQLSSGIDPTNENMTVGEFESLEEINTALFCLNIVNAGLPLNEMCQYLRDPAIGNRLEDNLINQDQAANIICYASVYGLYFQKSNEELLADLAALEYAVQMKTYASETLQNVCKSLDYKAAGLLGVNVQVIRNNVCNSTDGIDQSMSLVSNSIFTASTPYSTGWTTEISPFPTAPPYMGSAKSTDYLATTTILVTAPSISSKTSDNGTLETTTRLNTGSAITTTIIGTGPSIIFGTNGPVFSSATSAAGTVAPWLNTTLTMTADVTTVTASGGGLAPEASDTGYSFYNPPRIVRNRFD